MDTGIDLVFKIAAIGIIASILHNLLNQAGKSEQMSAEHRLRGLPSFEKFAKKIGVHPSTISRWRDAYSEFDEACLDCERIQVDILRDGGLSGIYAGRTATFLIKLAEEREAARIGGGEMRLEDFDDE